MLRLAEGWGRSEMGVEEGERERLRASWLRTVDAVEGFPQRTSTEETMGEREYATARERRRGMRDSEKPFITACGRFWGRIVLTERERHWWCGAEEF